MKPWYANKGPPHGKLTTRHPLHGQYDNNHKRFVKLQEGINLRERMYRHWYKPPPR